MANVAEWIASVYLTGSFATAVALMFGKWLHTLSAWRLLLAVWFWPVFWYQEVRNG